MLAPMHTEEHAGGTPPNTIPQSRMVYNSMGISINVVNTEYLDFCICIRMDVHTMLLHQQIHVSTQISV